MIFLAYIVCLISYYFLIILGMFNLFYEIGVTYL